MTFCHARALLFVLAAAVLGGCSPAQAPSATLDRSLEPRRAEAIMLRVIREQGEKSSPGRTFALSNGKKLVEEVAIAGTPYGIAYLSGAEMGALKGQLPPRKTELMRPTDKAITYLLYHDNYGFDSSSSHRVTALTAEKKLARDVGDFIVHVVKQRAHQ